MAILDSTIIKGDLKVLGKIKEHGNSGVAFSTTEQVYGTWIDGKTVYWRTFIVENVTLTTPRITVVSNSGISAVKIIKYEGVMYNSSSIAFGLEGWHAPQDTSIRFADNEIQMYTDAALGPLNIRLTIYYFKD